MNIGDLRLRDGSVAVRLGLTCFLLIVAGGYLAGMAHMRSHVAKKDGDAELTKWDLIGTYHGVTKPAAMAAVMDQEEHLSFVPDEKELAVLRAWLGKAADVVPGGADPLEQGFDPLDPIDDDPLPVEILEDRCLRCHAVGAKDGTEASMAIRLSGWPEVRKYVYPMKLEPVDEEILIVSTHTHALAMPVFTLLVGLFFLMTAWPRWIRHGAFALCFVGLLFDIAGWWLARSNEIWVGAVVAGGAMFGMMLCLMILGCLLDMWLLPRRSP